MTVEGPNRPDKSLITLGSGEHDSCPQQHPSLHGGSRQRHQGGAFVDGQHDLMGVVRGTGMLCQTPARGAVSDTPVYGAGSRRAQAATRVDQDQPASTPDPPRRITLAVLGRGQRALPRRVCLHRWATGRRRTPPLCRLRYGGSASIWGFAVYPAGRDGYEDNFLPSGLPAGSPEEALDCACGLYLNNPTAWLQPRRINGDDH